MEQDIHCITEITPETLRFIADYWENTRTKLPPGISSIMGITLTEFMYTICMKCLTKSAIQEVTLEILSHTIQIHNIPE